MRLLPLVVLIATCYSCCVMTSAYDVDTLLMEVYLQNLSERRIPFSSFNAMINSDVKDEFDQRDSERAEYQWSACTKKEWDHILKAAKEKPNVATPFILCNLAKDASGHDRVDIMKNLLLFVDEGVATNLEEAKKNTNVLYNNVDRTCVVTTLPPITAANMALLPMTLSRVIAVDMGLIARNSNSNNNPPLKGIDDDDDPISVGLYVQPVVSLAKLMNGAVGDVQRRMRRRRNLRSLSEESNNVDLSVVVNVQACPGVVKSGSVFDSNGGIFFNGDTKIDFRKFLLEQSINGANALKQVFLDGRETDRRNFWTSVLSNGIDRSDSSCITWIENLIVDYNPDAEVFSIRENEDALQQQQQQQQTSIQQTSCALSTIVGLSIMFEVCQIEVAPEIESSNVQASWITQSGVRMERPWFNKGLTGKGQVVAVSDSGIDVDNCYFYDSRPGFRKDGSTQTSRRKIVQYNAFVDDSDREYGHGTHVCGTIAGHKSEDGINESEGMAGGVARDAKIAFFDIGSTSNGSLRLPTNMERLLLTGNSAGAKIHSASWGSSSNDYGFNARFFDLFSYENDDFLAVIAAGNNGRAGRNTVGDPATAKNIISVGASQSESPDLTTGQLGRDFMAEFSGEGPTADGRRKPDIVAPGQHILSAGAIPSRIGECDPATYPTPNTRADGVISMAGTSMAAPVVAGTAAQIRQYFMEGWHPKGEKGSGPSIIPSGSLMKAIILNGGQNMTGTQLGGGQTVTGYAYDNKQSFGRISLVDSLYIPGFTNVQHVFQDRQEIFNGGTNSLYIEIDKSNDCKARLSATLVWADPPGAVGCRSCLMNDLDLTVERVRLDGRSNITYYPNQRDDRPNVQMKDTKNNAERVRVDADDKEIFGVHVKASNLITSKQKYALVVTGCFGGVPNTIVIDNPGTPGPPTGGGQGLDVGILGIIIAGGLVGVVLLVLCCFCVSGRTKD